MLLNILRATTDGLIWAKLVNTLQTRSQSFDPRNYGDKKLGDLVRATQLFDIDERRSADATGISVYARDQLRKQPATGVQVTS
jgi:hypothetical protein